MRWHNSLRADAPLLRVLRDEDMLDGLGAIGLMPAFMSKSGLPPYDVAAPSLALGIESNTRIADMEM